MIPLLFPEVQPNLLLIPNFHRNPEPHLLNHLNPEYLLTLEHQLLLVVLLVIVELLLVLEFPHRTLEHLHHPKFLLNPEPQLLLHQENAFVTVPLLLAS